MIDYSKILLMFIASLFFAACANDDDPSSEEKGRKGFILFGGKSNGGGIEWKNGRAGSRFTRTGSDVASEIPDNIGVFAFGNGQNTTYIFKNRKAYYKEGHEYKNEQTPNGKFAWGYSDSAWPYTEDDSEASSVQRPWEKMRYRFFAYSPWYPNKYVRVTAEYYDGFNTFTWDNIPGFSDKDFVLSNRIIEVDNTGETRKTEDVVEFQMRHILSRIRFFFKMSADYRKLRKIELNSLTVLTAGRVKTATFNFKSGTWDESVSWSNEQTGDAEPVTLTNMAEQHYFIPTDYPDTPFTNVYVYPQTNFNELKMRVNYTVYDSKGIVTRKSNVTNTVTFPNWTLLSGYYYDIKINIVPDYLYVLSDNDQDFDGYIIIEE